MLSDPALDSIVLHFTTKLIGGLIVAGLWWMYWQLSVTPFLKQLAERREDQARTVRPFPVLGLLAMTGLTIGFVFYCTIEPAFRSTTSIKNELAKERQQELDRRDSEFQKPEYTPPGNALDELSKKMLDENRASNEKAKASFEKLGAVHRNDTGGAQSAAADAPK